MLSGINQIKKCCFWELGNGSNIDIWDDLWIPGTKLPLHMNHLSTEGISKVSDLITNHKTWDHDKLIRCFDNNIVAKIKDIRIPREGKRDTPRWNLNKQGTFSVNSLYKHINSDDNVETKWSRIWKMKTTPAVNFFIWKVAHSILRNSMRVAAILPDIDTKCKLCNQSQETLSHLFLHCHYATQVWKHSNFDMDFVRNGTTMSHEWLTNCFENPNRGVYDID